MSVRIRFTVNDPSGRGDDRRMAKMDQTTGGDYDTAMVALFAVATADDDMRARICEMRFGHDWRERVGALSL